MSPPITLSPDETTLLLAWPEDGSDVDELTLARALGWPHSRVRAAMVGLSQKGLAVQGPPKPLSS